MQSFALRQQRSQRVTLRLSPVERPGTPARPCYALGPACRDVLVAILGLNTVHEDLPDRVKSLFWSIASYVYLYQPLHTSAVLGVHTAVRDCSRLDDKDGYVRTRRLVNDEPVTAEVNSFLSAMKAAAMDYLRRNTKQFLLQPDRNCLTKQVQAGLRPLCHLICQGCPFGKTHLFFFLSNTDGRRLSVDQRWLAFRRRRSALN